MSDVHKSRRAFFKDSAKLITTVAVAPFVLSSIFSSVGSAQEKRRSKAPPTSGPAMVDPKDGMAKSLKYTEDHTKAPESKGNKCATCSLYDNKKTATNGGKEVGPCTLFTGKNVYADGWCASWNKKA